VIDDPVIAYLQARGRAEPEPELVARIIAAVDEAPVARSPFAIMLPAAVVAGVGAIVVAVAVLLAQQPNVGPQPDESPAASPSPASIEELRAAVESAVVTLRESRGVEGIGTTSIYDELASAQWFSWRPNGDQVVVQRVDVDVAESAWWLDPDGDPPARGRNVMTTIWVRAGDRFFEGTADGWTVPDAREAPRVLSLMTAVLDGEEDLSELFAAGEPYEVSVIPLDGGGEEWTLSAPLRDGTGISRWRIGPEGELRSWVNEFEDLSPTVDDTNFRTGSALEIRILTEAPPIDSPDIGSTPNADALGLPSDFPLDAPDP
jgi:hypothetical protein